MKLRFYLKFYIFRSSNPEVFYKKGALKNFAKFTGKHTCVVVFFFHKIADLQLLKWRLRHRCFRLNFCKIFRNNLFYRTPLIITSLFCNLPGSSLQQTILIHKGNCSILVYLLAFRQASTEYLQLSLHS